MMNIIDIKAIVSLVKGEDILVAVDNTFASSYIQQPLTLRRYCDAFSNNI